MAIVKVQRPLMTTGPIEWLIYDNGRGRTQQIRDWLVPEHVKKAMAEDHKAYFQAQWSSLSGWDFVERIADQNW